MEARADIPQAIEIKGLHLLTSYTSPIENKRELFGFANPSRFGAGKLFAAP